MHDTLLSLALLSLAQEPSAASQRGFGLLDWAVLLAYFALLALSGKLLGRLREGTTHEYFLAGRRMPAWAVAISVVATVTSAATFLGAPEESYNGDLTYLSTYLGNAIAIAIVALVFIPRFYRANVTTVYDLLEQRFGRGAKQAASWTFMLGRVLASGARLFMAGIPLSMIVFRDAANAHVLIAIVVLAGVGIGYTLWGGIRSVIWTDVIQTCIFVGAAIVALVLLAHKIPLSTGQIVDAVRATPVGEGSKLTLLRTGLNPDAPGWGFDPGARYTLLTAVCGFALLMLAAYGTDHDLAQRMLTCKNSVRGSASAVLALCITVPVVAVFMLIGLLLYVFFQRPDLMGAAYPGRPATQGREAFLEFVLGHMPSGLSGLMMAGLFAAGLGSTNSALNAMAAAFVNDWYKDRRPGRAERHYLFVGRAAVVGWGVLVGAFACACVWWQRSSGQSLIAFALGVMNFAYAGLLGVFLTALVTKRGTTRSAIAALIAGALVVTALQPGVLRRWWAWVGEGAAPALAFPWVLTIGVGVATLVCAAAPGRSRARG